jgi:hypothetical protein
MVRVWATQQRRQPPRHARLYWPTAALPHRHRHRQRRTHPLQVGAAAQVEVFHGLEDHVQDLREASLGGDLVNAVFADEVDLVARAHGVHQAHAVDLAGAGRHNCQQRLDDLQLHGRRGLLLALADGLHHFVDEGGPLLGTRVQGRTAAAQESMRDELLDAVERDDLDLLLLVLASQAEGPPAAVCGAIVVLAFFGRGLVAGLLRDLVQHVVAGIAQVLVRPAGVVLDLLEGTPHEDLHGGGGGERRARSSAVLGFGGSGSAGQMR